MLFGTEPAAKLTRDACGLNDPLNAVLVDRMPFLGAIQVHNVEKGRSLIHPCPGHGRGIAAIDGFLSVVSLPQSYALPAANIDGRKDEHNLKRRQVRIRRLTLSAE
jgi:hypothetical protein